MKRSTKICPACKQGTLFGTRTFGSDAIIWSECKVCPTRGK